ncbi:MAG: hypothetical protein Q4C87_02245 [Actinomycetaceae bacterium]|nr:hypothetical protein [Actinomycetaceae bacterium]
MSKRGKKTNWGLRWPLGQKRGAWASRWLCPQRLRRHHPSPQTHTDDPERGDAIIEFVALVVILVVPALYFVLTLAKVQAGIFAVEVASRDAARVLARDPEAIALAEAKADLAFEDFGVASAASIDVGCNVCSGQGRDIRVTALVHVQWPLLPEWVTSGAIPIESSATLPVEEVVLK